MKTTEEMIEVMRAYLDGRKISVHKRFPRMFIKDCDIIITNEDNPNYKWNWACNYYDIIEEEA